MSSDNLELYHKYRPKTLKEVVGQEMACGSLANMIRENRVPHAMLFSGPSGTGKTTLARIMATKLRTDENNLTEINAAESRGIDTVRDITSRIQKSTLIPGNRVYIIDEAHKLTNDAQNAFLKPLEEPPRDVYFFLATTDPTKLIDTVRSRCTEIKCGMVAEEKLKQLVRNVAAKEKANPPLSDECAERIADVAAGSCRKSLTILQQVLQFKDEPDRLDAIQKSEMRRAAIDLCRAMWGNYGGKNPPNWIEVAGILKDLDEGAEEVRRMVMGYFGNIMVKSPKMAERCAMIMNYFRDPFYDNAGMSVLRLCCYEAVKQLGG